MKKIFLLWFLFLIGLNSSQLILGSVFGQGIDKNSKPDQLDCNTTKTVIMNLIFNVNYVSNILLRTDKDGDSMAVQSLSNHNFLFFNKIKIQYEQALKDEDLIQNGKSLDNFFKNHVEINFSKKDNSGNETKLSSDLCSIYDESGKNFDKISQVDLKIVLANGLKADPREKASVIVIGDNNSLTLTFPLVNFEPLDVNDNEYFTKLNERTNAGANNYNHIARVLKAKLKETNSSLTDQEIANITNADFYFDIVIKDKQ